MPNTDKLPTADKGPIADKGPTAQRRVLCSMRGVSHEFKLPSGHSLRVLENIDLDVREREVLALLGPSGCGKSTILRIFSGLVTPTTGSVVHHDRPLQGLNPEVAIVFQSFALYPWMTARQNIEVSILPLGLSGAEAKARIDRVITLVGLIGFADAYPRELSGGMKQRVGIARAIAVDRELLFMDEPFSQVDALTAESLRSEVLDLWAPMDSKPSSIVMVSHDIKEVVYMADRIVVLGTHPGSIRSIIENPLPRPRDYRSPDFLRIVDHIHDLITRSEMPDAPAPIPAAKKGLPQLEPLPSAKPNEIVGLIEYLSARRGQEDIFRIAADTGSEFGTIIAVVRAAEMLDLVDTPKRQVQLTPVGRRFADALADERRRIFRDRLLSLGLFARLRDLLARQEGGAVERDIIDEIVVLEMPQEDHQLQFATMLEWARFADLFKYDEAAQVVTLADGAGVSARNPVV